MIQLSSQTIGMILLASWSLAFGIGVFRLVRWWRERKSNQNISNAASFANKNL